MPPPAEALSSLCAIAFALALVISLSAQPQRNRAILLLGLMGGGLLLWGASNFVGFATAESVNRAAWAASAMSLTILLYSLFIIHYLRSESRAAPVLTYAAPLALAAALIMIWAGGAGSAGVLLTAFASAAFWLVMTSTDAQAPELRMPAVLMIAACAAMLLAPDWLYTGALLLATGATAWVGWVVVRRQIVTPLDDVREELRTANRDLRQALAETAALRASCTALTQQLTREGEQSSEFLDNLGHKLRTPLNSIAGYAELMESGLYGELNETQLHRLSIIRRNGDNLHDVINNMLDLNKIRARRLELEKANFSLNGLVEAAVAEAQQRHDKGLAVETTLDADIQMVNGDEGRIRQALTHVIDNALRCTFEGGVHVQTRTIRVQDGTSATFALPFTGWLNDGEWIIVEVADTGIGIAPEDQARVFDEFFQVADPRTEAYFGTGLGLTIARSLIDLHEGALWLKSVPESGSTFFIALRG